MCNNMNNVDMTGAETTIFNSRDSMTSDERAAVKSGEKRGEKAAMAEHPKRFELAGQRAKGRKQYEENYDKIDWSIV